MKLELIQHCAKVAICLLILGASIPSLAQRKSSGSVRVKGYVKKNGTYVAPHYRSNPDSHFSNNWSTKGNYNPYTLEAGNRNYPYGYWKISGSSKIRNSPFSGVSVDYSYKSLTVNDRGSRFVPGSKIIAARPIDKDSFTEMKSWEQLVKFAFEVDKDLVVKVVEPSGMKSDVLLEVDFADNWTPQSNESELIFGLTPDVTSSVARIKSASRDLPYSEGDIITGYRACGEPAYLDIGSWGELSNAVAKIGKTEGVIRVRRVSGYVGYTLVDVNATIAILNKTTDGKDSLKPVSGSVERSSTYFESEDRNGSCHIISAKNCTIGLKDGDIVVGVRLENGEDYFPIRSNDDFKMFFAAAARPSKLFVKLKRADDSTVFAILSS